MASHRLGLIKRLALGLTLAQALSFGAGGPARAQFFQPFGYSYDMPPVDDERPRFATPRAVSRILARRGFELVSGLGRRGDQVVVTGVSRREGAVRFFIDPYEGEVIHAIRLGPPPVAATPSYDEPPLPGARGGPRAPIERDMARRSGQEGLDPPLGGSRPSRPGQPLPKTSPPPAPGPVAAPIPAAPPVAPQAPAKPQDAAKPIEWAKPAEIARPAEPAKAGPPKVDPAKAEGSKLGASKTDAASTEPAKPPTAPEAPKAVTVTTPAPDKSPVAAKANDPNPSRPAGERSGVPGRRAIVPPKSARDAAAASSR